MYKLFYSANGNVSSISKPIVYEKMANPNVCSTLSLDGNLSLTGTGILSVNSIIIKGNVIDFNQIKTYLPLYNIIFGFINPPGITPPILPNIFGLKLIEFYNSEFKLVTKTDKFDIKNLGAEGKNTYQFKSITDKDIVNDVVYVKLKFVTSPGVTISFTSWINNMEVVFATFTATTKDTGDMTNMLTFKIQ
jgi:hypothetical protein